MRKDREAADMATYLDIFRWSRPTKRRKPTSISATPALLVLTRDHKRIGLLFLFTITVFFFIGGTAATLIRIQPAHARGVLVSETDYNKLFTIHGVIMVWFFLIPSIPATLGNFLLPLMIGAKDLAFPRLNLLATTSSSSRGFLPRL